MGNKYILNYDIHGKRTHIWILLIVLLSVCRSYAFQYVGCLDTTRGHELEPDYADGAIWCMDSVANMFKAGRSRYGRTRIIDGGSIGVTSLKAAGCLSWLKGEAQEVWWC